MLERTNIKLIPDAKTVAQISKLLEQYNLPHRDFDFNPHCTIIYSHDIVDLKKIRLSVVKLPVIGKNAHFEVFDTKNDGIVLVVEFECETAKKYFEYMKKTYNLSTRYDEYRAHITMQKNFDNSQNIILPKIDFALEFDRIEMDNGF